MKFAAQAASEEVVFPVGKFVSRVAGKTAGGDRGRPLHEGLLHAVLLRDACQWGAVVIHPVGNDGPAVVRSFADDVEFIASSGAVFGGVNGVIPWIDG